MKIVIISIVSLLLSFACIVAARQITLEELNKKIDTKTEKNETEIDHVNDKFNEFTKSYYSSSSTLNALIARNTEAIDGLKETLDRVQNILERIFLLILSSVFAAIIGGGGIGYVFGKKR